MALDDPAADLSVVAERIRNRLSGALIDLDRLEAVAPPGNFQLTAANVRRILARRRERDRFFPSGLFADPAWDMLLALYAAHLEGGKMTVSALCDAAAVPATTALRWIGNLEAAGMVERENDVLDRRKVLIGLSADAETGVREYFDSNPGWL